MKLIRVVSLLTLLCLATSRCFGLVMIQQASKEQAGKEYGASIRTEAAGTNQVGVWLEFAPKGKLATFSSVQLEITSGERRIVSATLAPSKQTADVVTVYFVTDREHLATSSLTVYYKIVGGLPPYEGLRFNVA